MKRTFFSIKNYEFNPLIFSSVSIKIGGAVLLFSISNCENNASKTVSEKTKTASLDSAFIKNSAQKMVKISGGSFEMGHEMGIVGKDEKPAHQVTIHDFFLSKTETTVGEFAQFVKETGYKTDAERGDGSFAFVNYEAEKQPQINWRYDELGKIRGDDEQNFPVVHVSWNDAIQFCNWRSEKEGLKKVYSMAENQVEADWSANGYRLPTEAEWEFAARNGGKNDEFAWGNGPTAGNVCDLSVKKRFRNWSIFEKYDDGFPFAAPVEKFPQGSLGLFSMTGNVREWCWDGYDLHFYEKSPAADPRGPEKSNRRVVRGGSWFNSPNDSRTTSRDCYFPATCDLSLGFRVAKN